MKLSILAASIAHKWGQEDDFATIRRLEEAIVPARATIIQRRYDGAKIFPQSLLVPINLDLIQVDESECSCLITGRKAVRTENKLPRPIIARKDTFFSYFGQVNGKLAFSALLFEEVEMVVHRRFSANETFYTYNDLYAYVINDPSLRKAKVRYVPENPLEVLKLYPGCECECLQDGELEIEDSLIEGIKGLLENDRPALLKPSKEIEINE